MEASDWLTCDLLESVPGKVSGAVVFKNTRLPVEAITENVDSYLHEGLSLDKAIEETLTSFPSTPGGAEAIRAVLSHRAAHEHQLQL